MFIYPHVRTVHLSSRIIDETTFVKHAKTHRQPLPPTCLLGKLGCLHAHTMVNGKTHHAHKCIHVIMYSFCVPSFSCLHTWCIHFKCIYNVHFLVFILPGYTV